MPLSTDAIFGLSVVGVTVVIIAGAAWYASTRPETATNSPEPVTDTSRLVREDDPTLGSSDARVTVVEFGDFECPACGSLHPILKQVKAQYADQSVRFVYRQFPLTQVHDHAQLAAEASLAAEAQGKFWEYHDLLFENQSNLTREDLERYAEQLGLNVDEFRAALDDHRYADQINSDVADGYSLGVPGTPTLFINDTRYTGTYSADALSAAIDERL